jgi:hypothetical protein
VQFWGQLGVGRIFGRFLVLEQRHEGAVLVHIGKPGSPLPKPLQMYLVLVR